MIIKGGETLDDWDGACLSLALQVLEENPGGSTGLLYMKRPDFEALLIAPTGERWGFHAVPVLEGQVHDAWWGSPCL